MWIMTNNAFVSIVEHRDDPDILIVRGRFPGDVARFLGYEHYEELVTPDADYRYRVITSRRHVCSAIMRAVESIDYGNFKDSIGEDFRKNAAMQTWSVWHRAQELQAYGSGEPLDDGWFHDELERDHDEPYEADRA